MSKAIDDMEDEEYIQLQKLLSKFRTVAMKQYGANDTPQAVKERTLQIIRRIDYLRKNTILNIYGGTNE